ncbi:VC0807 family protein [Streptomyces galbus]|uniref:DUF3159 domain-containing protein n=1 Tax=Streptomyces galbus TaxID=33898 RepID=A0ABX1IX85_STRGB|nr:VC0807 family protein [Streptomyces galbus]NKQ28802.1 hypothetical protein [Streptomyces galbus]
MTTKTHAKRPALTPLIVDVAVPVGGYYLLKDGFGTSAFAALAGSSVVPALRTAWGVVRERALNGLAALILAVNVVGLLLGLVSGDPRLMLAKESAVGSVVGLGVLVSVTLGKPLMTAAMKPWLVKGRAEREAAWERLCAGSADFRRAERVFSGVWGGFLLAECVVRVAGAYTLPVDTMVWLGSVILVVTLGSAFVVSGALAAGPMARMLLAEVEVGAATDAEAGEETAAVSGRTVGAPEVALAR